MPDPLDPDRLRTDLAAIDPVAAADPSAIRVVRAPGRVNLIGEHTDYTGGLVLPAAISLEIRIAYVPTDDRHVRVTLDATGEVAEFDLDAIGVRRGHWIDYVAGTAWALAAAGIGLRGFYGVLASSIPMGAGLGSSAALELASAWALAADPPPMLDGLALAQVAQRAENEFVGIPCGLMDQFASALGRSGAALYLDCRSLAWHPVPLPLVDLAIVVCHAGSTRHLAASPYGERRAECARAVAVLASLEPGVTSLRDVDVRMLARHAGELGPVLARRVRHVVEENARVSGVEAALAARDANELGRLFAASHASLRDLFEVSTPELDVLVEIARATDGVVASRLTGAGFGGCTVNLVRRDRVPAFRAALERPGLLEFGQTPVVYEVEPVNGAGQIAHGAS